jgi:predicted transcriptional regulator
MLNHQKLFEELENYRITNQLSITKLVELVGIGRTTYYEWKSGKAPAKLSVYEKVEKFLQGE